MEGEKLRRVDGGVTRHDSVNAGLEALDDSVEWVAIHDGARPLVSPEDINRCVAAEKLDNAVNDMAQKIASKSPEAIALGKDLFYTQLEEGMAAAYTRAGQAITCNMQSPATQSAIDKFLNKSHVTEWPDRQK